MPWPSLSIVIATLNRAAFIERTILSILRQDYPGPLQIIVADGGSRDGTIEILEKYPQITWWSKKDAGVADAMNQGLAAADGEVLALQGSDDYYLRDAFRNSMSAMVADPGLGLVSGTDIFLQPDGRAISCSQLQSHDITPRTLLLRRVVPMHCCFFRRKTLESTGPLRSFGSQSVARGGNIGNVGVEIDLWYRILHFHSGLFVPYHTAAYQLHPAQMTSNSPFWFANMTEMVESCERDPRYAAQFRLDPSDKLNVYLRWQIQQERLLGNETRVAQLLERVRTDPAYTDETRQFLELHGFLPKPQKPKTPGVRPAPELDWYLHETTEYAKAI